jgi:hypothetical protein
VETEQTSKSAVRSTESNISRAPARPRLIAAAPESVVTVETTMQTDVILLNTDCSGRRRVMIASSDNNANVAKGESIVPRCQKLRTVTASLYACKEGHCATKF